jgi:N-methylhydantoinase B
MSAVLGGGSDPVLLEVIKHELGAISEEMAIALHRTGRSPMMRVGDFGAAVCDEWGRFFDSGYTFPLQLVVFDVAVRHVLGKWEGRLDPGDVILLNDPYSGMGHMPDTAVMTPIFWQDRIVAYTIAYSHHTDTGGRYAGGISSQATSSFEEGLRVPPVKLEAAGMRNEALLDTILANVRTPDDWLGDINAKVAGCRRGDREMRALLDKYGLESLRGCCAHLMERSESAARAAIRAIPDGRYEARSVLTDDGFGNPTSLPLKLAIIVEGDRMTLDFGGTHAQVPSAINCPYSITKGMALGALKTVVAPDAVMNDGFIRAIRVVVPEGSILNPRYPAAVGGRAPVGTVVVQLVMDALAAALPDQIPILGESGDLLHFSGQQADGRPFALMDFHFGGWGGRPGKDGIDGVTMMLVGSSGLPPAELIEREFPVVVEGFGLVPDTAGPGKNRGSLAVYRRWRFLTGGHVMLRTSRPGAPPPGLMGGQAGSRSVSILNSGGETLTLPSQTHYHLDVKAGDIIYHEVGGSAGHGNPLEREPAAVLHDLLEGTLSISAAREQYGVIVTFHPLVVDVEQTTLLRSHLQSVQSQA